MRFKKINLLNDVYFTKKYASLYADKQDKVIEFEFTEDGQVFRNIALKRPIKTIYGLPINDEYFDLETPYGYGGYLSTSYDQIFLENAFKAYKEFCISEKIIAEFIRFHPKNTFHLLAKPQLLDFLRLDRKTISIDLKKSNQERWKEYQGTARNIIRRCDLNMNLLNTNDIDSFMDIYESTMKRNNANSFFFFEREYYENLLAIPNTQLFATEFSGAIINMCFILIGNEYAHYHLSAGDFNFMKLNGNYFLIDKICDYLREHFPHISELHLGGGRTNAPDDSLLTFKSKFSKKLNDFYIGGKIFNHEIYKKYINSMPTNTSDSVKHNFFLNYRI